MVGSSVSLKKGVRKVLVEAGWPRVPRDGFIRGGGLAVGTIQHLGMKRANEDLRLLLDPDGTPLWVIEHKNQGHLEVRESNLRSHIAILLTDSRLSTRHP